MTENNRGQQQGFLKFADTVKGSKKEKRKKRTQSADGVLACQRRIELKRISTAHASFMPDAPPALCRTDFLIAGLDGALKIGKPKFAGALLMPMKDSHVRRSIEQSTNNPSMIALTDA